MFTNAFTLLEILLASVAAAMILGAVYGMFSHAIRLRDSATRRVRDSRVRARAEQIIRRDLRGGLVSGGVLAAVFTGDSASADRTLTTNANAGSLPGYLRFTTTTGRNDANGLYGDVQEIEYYLARDPAADSANATGILMRAVTRNLLDTSGLASSSSSSANHAAAPSDETPVLAGVQSFEVSFYDGANWQPTWDFSGLAETANPTPTPAGADALSAVATQIVSGQTSLPDAVRIAIQQAPPTPGGPLPAPLEILIPWTTQPYAAATPANAGEASAF